MRKFGDPSEWVCERLQYWPHCFSPLYVQVSSSWIMAPRDVQVFIPETCECYSGWLPGIILVGLWHNHGCLYKREAKGDVTQEKTCDHQREMLWSMLPMKRKDGRSHDPQNAMNTALGSGKERKTDSALPSEKNGPAHTLVLACWNRFWTSDSPVLKKEWMCVVLSLSLWHFVTTAKGNSYKGSES